MPRCFQSVLAVCLLAALGQAAPASPVGKAAAQSLLDNSPIRFERNLGQWDSRIRYSARTAQYTLSLTDREAVVSPATRAGAPARSLAIRLRGANPAPRLEAIEPLRSTSGYFIGNDPDRWRRQVPHFAKVRYRDVYPGIDLVYYGSDRKLEYDFVVAPGADPSRIRLKFGGADRITLEDGSLKAKLGDQWLIHNKPLLYQVDAAGRRVPVWGNYRLVGNDEIAFSIGAYDRDRTLVIDPVVYSTFFGGINQDVATVVAAEPSGRLWVAGFTGAMGFPPGSAPIGDTVGGGLDVFIARLDPAKVGADSLEYVGYLGGSLDEEPNAIHLDEAGNIYLAGYTSSGNFPLGGEAHQRNSGGGRDAFILKFGLDSDGAPVVFFSNYHGGEGVDVANAVTTDSAGRIYVTGYTTSMNLPTTSNTLQGLNRGGYDAFLVVYDLAKSAAENFIYATYLGGLRTESATAVAVDRNGLIYMAGYTASDDFPIAGALYAENPAGRGDLFLARLDLSKPGLDSLVYATYFGGKDFEIPYAMLLDGDGRVCLAGYTLSKDFPLAGEPAQSANAGNADVFVLRFDLRRAGTAALDYSTYVGGSDGDVAYAMTLDASGRIYVAGYTVSRDFPSVGDPVQKNYGGGASDAFLLRLDPAVAGPAALDYSTYLGGRGTEAAFGLALDRALNVYLAGFSQGEGFPIVEGAYKMNLDGVSDAFVTKLRP